MKCYGQAATCSQNFPRHILIRQLTPRGHSHLEDGVDDWILREVPGDTGDSER